MTPEQIDTYQLPTRPTKAADTRSAAFQGQSVEVDAMPSDALRRIVREAIESWIEPTMLRLTRVAEESERDILLRIAGDWGDAR